MARARFAAAFFSTLLNSSFPDASMLLARLRRAMTDPTPTGTTSESRARVLRAMGAFVSLVVAAAVYFIFIFGNHTNPGSDDAGSTRPGSAPSEFPATSDAAGSNSTPSAARRGADLKNHVAENVDWIDGRVQLPDGSAPVGNVQIIARPEPRHGSVSAGGNDTTTQCTNGKFTIPFDRQCDWYSLVALGDFIYGHAPLRVRRSHALKSGIVMVVDPAGVIECTVRDTDGFAIPGARVRTDVSNKKSFARGAAPPVQNIYVTNKEGFVHIPGVPPAGVWLLAVAPGSAPATMGPLRIAPHAATPVTLTLQPGSVVSGRVVDDSGRGVEHVKVTVWIQGDRWPGLDYGTAVSNADGRFLFNSLEPGAHRITAARKGWSIVKMDESVTPEPAPGSKAWIIQMSDRGGLSGIVMDESGSPVESARIATFPQKEAEAYEKGNLIKNTSSRTLLHTAVSDAQGRFSMTGLGDGPWLMQVERAGFVPYQGVSDHGQADSVIRLRRCPDAGVIVKNQATGAPIPGAILTFSPATVSMRHMLFGRPETAPVATDAAGRAALSGFGEGAYTIHASAPGFAKATISDQVLSHGGEARTLDIELTPAASLAGLALAATTGKPEAGLQLMLEPEYKSASGTEKPKVNSSVEPLFAITGGDGTFIFTDIPSGGWRVYVPDERCVGTRSEWISLQPGESRENFQVFVRRGGSIEGTVVDGSGSTSPYGDITAILQDTNSPEAVFQRPRRTEADPMGAFRIDGLLPGRWKVTASIAPASSGGAKPAAGEIGSVVVTVTEGLVSRVELGAAPAGCRVMGRVVRGGAPLAGGIMTCSPLNTATDEMNDSASRQWRAAVGMDGTFMISGVPAGDVKIIYSFPNSIKTAGTPDRYSKVIAIPAAGSMSVEMDIPAGGVVAGRILEAGTGRPLQGVLVLADWYESTGDRSSDTFSVTSDAAGSFMFSGLFPGKYSFLARPNRPGGAQEGRGFRDSRSDFIQIHEGSNVNVDLILEAGCAMSVLVVDTEGLPLADVPVTATGGPDSTAQQNGTKNIDNRGTDARVVRTNTDGRAVVSGLAPGRWRAQAMRSQYIYIQSGETVLEPGAPVSITLQYPACVPFRVDAIDEAGAPVAIQQIVLRDAAGTVVFSQNWSDLKNTSASSRTIQIKPGSYELTVTRPGGRMDGMNIEAPAGGSVQVRIPAQAAR